MSQDETDLKKDDGCTDGNTESSGMRSSRRIPKCSHYKVPFDGHDFGPVDPHCEGPDSSGVKLRQNVHSYGDDGTGGFLIQPGSLNGFDDHST